jgi:hypothetical protein
VRVEAPDLDARGPHEAALADLEVDHVVGGAPLGLVAPVGRRWRDEQLDRAREVEPDALADVQVA